MSARPVEIVVTRFFPHERESAYAWLTDFQDDDASRTGAVLVGRRVVLREKTRVVYEGETEVLGRKSFATTDVALDPPSRWTARVTKGLRLGSATDYALEKVPGGCELTVTYRFVFADPKTTRAVRILRPLVKLSLVRMWRGFAADMARDLA